jgi:diadenosine tetraphosphatase ApaH/serine/threonine PP2A family protein phosphatase
LFLTVFSRLPYFATIKKKIFCVHGGLTPLYEEVLTSFFMNQEEREPPESELTDFLWSEFSEDAGRFKFNENKRLGHLFGPEQVFSFLRENKMQLMVNSG